MENMMGKRTCLFILGHLSVTNSSLCTDVRSRQELSDTISWFKMVSERGTQVFIFHVHQSPSCVWLRVKL